MKGRLGLVIGILVGLCAQIQAQNILFDFDSAPAHSGLPIDVSAGGVTAHFTDTGQGFSIQAANVLGFTPSGFAGNCIYPDSVYLADLQAQFSVPLSDFSIMYSPEEYACDSSARMRVTAYLNGVLVGTNTVTADPPGTWPTGTLRFTSTKPFNYVVIHYDAGPPTGGDWGPVFMADNMRVTVASAAVANDDAYSVSVNKPLSVVASNGILRNDFNATGSQIVLVTPPSHGQLTILPAGAFTFVPTKDFVGTDTFVYEDKLNGQLSNHATVTIKVQPAPNQLSINPIAVLGGEIAQGTVTLSVKAPVGGTAVNLSVNAVAITEPSQVVVPAGATSVIFAIQTKAVSGKTLATFTATLNEVTKQTVLTIHPLSALGNMTVSPATLVGGASSTGTITLLSPVPASSETIVLTSSSSALTIPSTVVIPAGRSSATFSISTTPVSSLTIGTLGANFNGVKLAKSITLTTPPIASLKLQSASIKGGTSTSATVTLSGKAGPKGDVIQLASGNSAVGVPSTVVVPSGATSATFTVTSKAVTVKLDVKLTASFGTSAVSSVLTVTH